MPIIGIKWLKFQQKRMFFIKLKKTAKIIIKALLFGISVHFTESKP